MPKKKNQDTQAEQIVRFRMTVRDLVAAGELNLTEANEAFERLVGKAIIVGAAGRKSENETSG